MNYARALLAAALLAFIGLADAQGNGLYGPDMPTDVAFIRVIHAGTATEDTIEAHIGQTSTGELEAASVTDYYMVNEGPVSLSVGEEVLEFEAALGGFYSAAWFAGELRLLEDDAHTDPARAQLALYNFTEFGAIDLKTADGETEVIAGIAPGTSGHVVVNIAQVAFGIFYEGELKASLDEPALARGEAYSVIVFGDEDELEVRYLQADIAQE